MNEAIQVQEPAAAPKRRTTAFTEGVGAAGLAAALGGIAAVLAPEDVFVAVGAAVVGAVGGFLIQERERRVKANQ